MTRQSLRKEVSHVSAQDDDYPAGPGPPRGRSPDRRPMPSAGRCSSTSSGERYGARIVEPARERPEVYTLVYPGEANLRAGRLSVLSPMGTALLGARKGDVLTVLGATGPRRIKVEFDLVPARGRRPA